MWTHTHTLLFLFTLQHLHHTTHRFGPITQHHASNTLFSTCSRSVCEAVMRVMSSESPANEKQSCVEEEDKVAAALTTSSLFISDHTHVNTSPPDTPHTETAIPPAPPPPPVPTPDLRKRRVRSFYWKPIPEERVRRRTEPNLWTLGRGFEERRSTFHIDVAALEELFGHHDPLQPASTPGRTRSRDAPQNTRHEITILSTKRSMNVAIFLKRLKRSNQSIIREISDGDSISFGPEPLRELLKLLPDAQEVEKLRTYRGDPAQLNTVDSFIYHLTLLPKFHVRIEVMLLKEDFVPSCSSLKRDISTVRSAAGELLSCEELHSVLLLVLDAGNIMNAGGYGGNAVGFRLSSLLSLADTKANKPGMNLLHFVVLEAQKKDEKLLMFPEKLQDVERAARVSVEELEVEWQDLNRRIRQVEEKLQDDPQLLQQVQPFLQSAGVELEQIGSSMLELQQEGNKLIDFFCEDIETFKLDECFHVFQHFCSKFKKAAQDNVERKVRAESQMKQIRELGDKRRSWSGGDKVGGVFSSRSSSETDVSTALKKGGLFDLLTSQNLRRSRQQLSNSSLESLAHSDTFSPPLIHTQKLKLQDKTTPHKHTLPNHSLTVVQVETHTLVPALQAFHFSSDTHHNRSSAEKDCLNESGDAAAPPVRNSMALPQLQSVLEGREETKEDKISANKTTVATSDPVQDGYGTASEKDEAFQVNINQNKEQITSDIDDISIEQCHELTLTSSALSDQADTSLITAINQASESKLSHHASGNDHNHKGKESYLDAAEHVTSSTKSLRKTHKPSSSSLPSSLSKGSSHYRVRTLTPSESQTMRKVISLGRPPNTAQPSGTVSIRSKTQTSRTHMPVSFHPSTHTQTSRTSRPIVPTMSHSTAHIQTSKTSKPVAPMMPRPSPSQASRAPIATASPCNSHTGAPKALRTGASLRRSVQKPLTQKKSAPEEKMCRSTMRALAQAGGEAALQHNTARDFAPRFARNTVASSTRSSITTDTHPVHQSTRAVSLKGPSLNRTASLRAAQNRATPPASTSRRGSAHVPLATGHDRKNISSLSQRSSAGKDLQTKAARPAWK